MAVTTPEPSCPRTSGVGSGHSPRTTWRSEWQTPAAAIATSTSPARGGSRCTSRTSIGAPTPVKTAARIILSAVTRPSISSGATDVLAPADAGSLVRAGALYARGRREPCACGCALRPRTPGALCVRVRFTPADAGSLVLAGVLYARGRREPCARWRALRPPNAGSLVPAGRALRLRTSAALCLPVRFTAADVGSLVPAGALYAHGRRFRG